MVKQNRLAFPGEISVSGDLYEKAVPGLVNAIP